MIKSGVKKLAKILRDYLYIGAEIPQSDIIMVMWSSDVRVAERWAELRLEWKAPLILFSWWLGRSTSKIEAFQWLSEAEIFAQQALSMWVPEDVILLEKKSTNTGQNIQFSYDILKDKDIHSIIIVQKPYMERRAHATFAKQRPDSTTSFVLASPCLSFDEYPCEKLPFDHIVSMMVGDLQRIIEYPKSWRQAQQDIPMYVMSAYEELVALWYTKHMILQ